MSQLQSPSSEQPQAERPGDGDPDVFRTRAAADDAARAAVVGRPGDAAPTVHSNGNGDGPDGHDLGAACPIARLSLTDFLDVRTLQEMQDSFTRLTRLATTIRDADGRQLTNPTDPLRRTENDRVLEWLLTEESALGEGGAQGSGGLVAPIIVEGQKLGSITIENAPMPGASPALRNRLREVATALGMKSEDAEQVVTAAEDAAAPNKAASVQFLYLMANSIARLCYQEFQLRQRLQELSALYRVTASLAGQRDLQKVLDTAARTAADVMHVKAAMIRLLEGGGERRELHARATFNLSPLYVNKGALLYEKSEIFKAAMAGETVYVSEMSTDPRVLYRQEAGREGLASMWCTGLIFQGEAIGVMQLFTAEARPFTKFEASLFQAIAQLVAAAIDNARQDQMLVESERVQRQLRMATDVQKRMLPREEPHVAPFQIAARYVPSFELGGDFYDFIDLGGNLGVAIGDVVGKGIAASLLMAAVRSSLRAFAQDVYDIDEIIERVNGALVRDTLSNEFATLWYGVLDPKSRRLTYCNAGHEPPLLLRKGQITPLDVGGMIVGVDATQRYDRGIVHLQQGDLLCIYTDGLIDGQNFEQKKFGRTRVKHALLECADLSAHASLNHILWELRRFTGLNRSIDDLTIVMIRCE